MRNLIRIWIAKCESGEFDADVEAPSLLADYEAMIVAPERMIGRQALEIKGGSAARTVAEKRAYVRDGRPRGFSVAQRCRLMGIARSTYYSALAADRDAELVARIEAICAEFEATAIVASPPSCATRQAREQQEGATGDARA